MSVVNHCPLRGHSPLCSKEECHEESQNGYRECKRVLGIKEDKMKSTEVIMEFTGDQFEKALEDEAFNIVMNMSGGLEPKDLQQDEIDILKKKYGDNWFYELGYTDEWEKPNEVI